MAIIEFHLVSGKGEGLPEPFPASREVPGWVKGMASDFEKGGTVKRCPPFIGAMTAGYIIPAPGDVTFRMGEDGELSATGTMQFVGLHFKGQYTGSPFEGERVVKFENPWVIVTSAEYVCVVTAPVNRFEMPFEALTGVVETGSYYREVYLPMVCRMRKGEEFRLRRGMPMVQVIPMLREEWKMVVGVADEGRRAEQNEMLRGDAHFYKERFWRGMRFE